MNQYGGITTQEACQAVAKLNELMTMTTDSIFKDVKPTTVYCQGTKKIGIPCKRYLGKVEGKAELLCPICKTVNVVDREKITVKEEN